MHRQHPAPQLAMGVHLGALGRLLLTSRLNLSRYAALALVLAQTALPSGSES